MPEMMRIPTLLTVLLAAASAICAIGDSPSIAFPEAVENDVAMENKIVSKTVVNSNMRAMYYVGLEGAGHHYIDKVFEYAFQTKNAGFGLADYLLVNSMVDTSSTYARSLEYARNRMKRLRNHENNVQPPGAVVKIGGRFSYPSGNGPAKVFQYIDVRTLAGMAEEEGVDLRILYLRRPAKQILVSTTNHRGFDLLLGDDPDSPREQLFMHYVQILFTNIAVMHSLLAEIDPAFVVCHEYGLLGDPEQAGRIADFVTPSAEVAQELKTALVEVASGGSSTNESLPYVSAEAVVTRLQEKLDAFESTYCG